MFVIGTDVFFQFPSESSRRVLHPGNVVATSDGAITVQFEEAELPFEEGLNGFLFYEHRREFMQQPARVTGIDSIESLDAESDESDQTSYVMIETAGDPVSAESRQCYRVSTVISDRTARVGDEDSCKLLDLSPTGFAVIAAAEHQLGDMVEAMLTQGAQSWTGRACVQSVRQMRNGSTRYGLYCANDHANAGGQLAKGLQQLTMNVQREQLRRLSGAA